MLYAQQQPFKRRKIDHFYISKNVPMFLQASFVGAMAIADLVKTTLGPKGMVRGCAAESNGLGTALRLCISLGT